MVKIRLTPTAKTFLEKEEYLCKMKVDDIHIQMCSCNNIIQSAHDRLI